MNVIDYGLSFISGVGPANKVRFWVESRTRLMETAVGNLEAFLAGQPVNTVTE